jgi:hypothetical protein
MRAEPRFDFDAHRPTVAYQMLGNAADDGSSLLSSSTGSHVAGVRVATV